MNILDRFKIVVLIVILSLLFISCNEQEIEILQDPAFFDSNTSIMSIVHKRPKNISSETFAKYISNYLQKTSHVVDFLEIVRIYEGKKLIAIITYSKWKKNEFN